MDGGIGEDGTVVLVYLHRLAVGGHLQLLACGVVLALHRGGGGIPALAVKLHAGPVGAGAAVRQLQVAPALLDAGGIVAGENLPLAGVLVEHLPPDAARGHADLPQLLISGGAQPDGLPAGGDGDPVVGIAPVVSVRKLELDVGHHKDFLTVIEAVAYAGDIHTVHTAHDGLFSPGQPAEGDPFTR